MLIGVGRRSIVGWKIELVVSKRHLHVLHTNQISHYLFLLLKGVHLFEFGDQVIAWFFKVSLSLFWSAIIHVTGMVLRHINVLSTLDFPVFLYHYKTSSTFVCTTSDLSWKQFLSIILYWNRFLRGFLRSLLIKDGRMLELKLIKHLLVSDFFIYIKGLFFYATLKLEAWSDCCFISHLYLHSWLGSIPWTVLWTLAWRIALFESLKEELLYQVRV